MFGSNLQPAVPTVYHVDLRSGFNIGDELRVLARSAKDAGWLNDFVAFPSRSETALQDGARTVVVAFSDVSAILESSGEA